MKIYLLGLIYFMSMNCNVFKDSQNKDSSKKSILAYAIVNRNVSPDNEELSGGDTTVFDTTSQAFQRSAQNMTDVDRLVAFARGHAVFNVTWLSPGNSANPGLGPTFNSGSCNGCHSLDGRGKPTEGSAQASLLYRLSIPGSDSVTKGPLDVPNFGGQFNPNAISGVQNEGTVTLSYTEVAGTFPDGQTYSLRKPTYTIALNGSIGTQPSNMLVSPRIAQQNFGLGLLEAIAEEVILSYADTDDKNGDGISGKANYVYDSADGKTKLGRFGWKANQPNLNQQNQAAFLGDIGITSSLFINENCPGTQSSGNCGLSSNTGKGTGVAEISQASIDALNLYMKTIAVPGRRNWADANVKTGKSLMVSIGCTSCHLERLQTSILSGIPEVSNQTIRPYTDLLLHDMGSELADNRPDFLADGREWRTPPLWGIGLVKTVNGHDNLLHDGRARGFTEAILWHGGEAEKARDKFKNLSKSDRDAIVKFLESL
jgi:CxxC motif-containing protein (DUF1111 family)